MLKIDGQNWKLSLIVQTLKFKFLDYFPFFNIGFDLLIGLLVNGHSGSKPVEYGIVLSELFIDIM